MLDFYGVTAAPNVPHKKYKKSMLKAINKAYSPFPAIHLLTSPNISRADIVSALQADSKFTLLPLTASAVIENVIQTAPDGALMVNASLNFAPEHVKRMLSEFTGISTSIAMCMAAGMTAFCTVQDWNRTAPANQQIIKHWNNDGPDYLVADANKQEIYFMEVKGSSKKISKTPRKFNGFKLQSLNAFTTAFSANRYLLSYIHACPGHTLSAFWINNRDLAVPETNRAATIIISFLNYTNTIENAGLRNLAQDLRNRLSSVLNGTKVDWEGAPPDPNIKQIDKYYVPLDGAAVSIAITVRAFKLFHAISFGRWWSDEAEQEKALSILTAMANTRRRINSDSLEEMGCNYAGPISKCGVALIWRSSVNPS